MGVPHSINSLEADLLRDAVAQLWEGPNGADQNERLRPAVENLVYILNHHWLMWAHGWELTIGNDFSPGDLPTPQELATATYEAGIIKPVPTVRLGGVPKMLELAKSVLGDHPDPDYLGGGWWRIAEPATGEAG
jgi:hypothetical protein